MKKIIKKLGQAVQVVLLAPIKLPAKAMSVLKYIAVGLGIMEQILEDGHADTDISGKEGRDEDHD